VKALLLAGGLGTRLRPITLTCPKPLLPVGNLPIIKRIILNLRAQGIKEFVFLLHYQPERFIQALGDGKVYNAAFDYVIMEKDLSTAGSVKFAQAHITETTLIYSADILADLPLRRMLAFHRRRRAMATLALYPITTPLPYGLVLRESDGRIRRFFEKPTWPQVFSDWINAAIYLIEPDLLDHIPDGDRPVFFEQEVFPPLAAAKAAIFGFPLEGYWRDVGTPEDLRMANLDYLHGKLSPLLLAPGENPGGVDSTSLPASIAPDAHLEASVVGANSRIDSHARIRGAVIFDEVHIGPGVQVNEAIIMRGVEIEAKAEIHRHAVIAERARVGAAAIVAANAVVRSGQQIAPGETVPAKRVLPTGYIRRFVDGGSLLGSIGGGMSTELMRWVGKSFALRQMKAHAESACSSDLPRALLLVTQEEDRFSAWTLALAQGMLSAGCEVYLLESVTLPVARWALQMRPYLGGIYLGADRHAALIRLALMHPSAEDFTTGESCSLERIDLIEAAKAGNLHLLEAAMVREGYLHMVLNCVWGGSQNKSSPQFAPFPHAVLDQHIPVRVGVVGAATEQIVSQFFAMLGWPAQIEAFPVDMSPDFRRHTRSAQKLFAQSLTSEVGVGIWLGGVCERIQLALPQHGMLPRGSSDAVMAQLLTRHNPDLQLVAGWLFPHRGQPADATVRRYEGCLLTAASLRAAQNGARLIGFDGRGGIAFPIPASEATTGAHHGIAYADALMAMAHLLAILSKTYRSELETLLPRTTLGYRLMPCPDETKAYLMRRLVEVYDNLNFAFSDGIRLEEAADRSSPNWVVIRPCAGMEALEIYWEENGSTPSLNVAIRRRLARWRVTQEMMEAKSVERKA
jgi:mannose-1-phosphate guanylyltransferase/phosphomannomutase